MKRNAYILSATQADVLTISHIRHTERRRAILGRFRKLCGALMLAVAGIAQAAPVTYYFGGQLSYVDSNLSPTLAVGNGFSGSFTYESTAADSLPGDPNRGFYGPGPAFTVTINSLPFSITGGGAGSVGVEQLIGTDRFSVGSGDAPTTGSNINGYFAWSFTLFMSDSTGSAFDSDALPSSELNLALFDNSLFQLDFFNEQNLSPTASVGGRLTYLSLTDPNSGNAVPEPSTLHLLPLAMTIAGIAWITRRSQVVVRRRRIITV